MTDETLRTGMRVTEAIQRARGWWDLTGRKLIKTQTNLEREKVKVLPAGKRTPAMIIRGNASKVYPSGILNAFPWEQLNKRERLQVVKLWHFHYIEEPMIKSGELRPTAEDLDYFRRLRPEELDQVVITALENLPKH